MRFSNFVFFIQHLPLGHWFPTLKYLLKRCELAEIFLFQWMTILVSPNLVVTITPPSLNSSVWMTAQSQHFSLFYGYGHEHGLVHRHGHGHRHGDGHGQGLGYGYIRVWCSSLLHPITTISLKPDKMGDLEFFLLGVPGLLECIRHICRYR